MNEKSILKRNLDSIYAPIVVCWVFISRPEVLDIIEETKKITNFHVLTHKGFVWANSSTKRAF